LATAVLSFAGWVVAPPAEGRNLMTADGPGGTYELLQGAYTVEVPDCGHMVPHITEEMDEQLGKNVFVFHAHVNEDNDRCQNFDRQRTEIRARAGEIIGQTGDTVYYRWKFKLPAGFQTSPNFTHIFQIKSDLAPPIMTLTPRGTEIAIDGRIGVHGTTELQKLIDTWVVVDLKILYSHEGQVEMAIRRLSDKEMLFFYSAPADMWDDAAGGHDIKFGIYRSLNSREQLRDEQVRFADFCGSKQSATDCDDAVVPPPPGAPPAPPTDGGRGDSGACSFGAGSGPSSSWALGLALLACAAGLRRRRR